MDTVMVLKSLGPGRISHVGQAQLTKVPFKTPTKMITNEEMPYELVNRHWKLKRAQRIIEELVMLRYLCLGEFPKHGKPKG